MAKTCVICGKPSGMYPLCVEHLKAKNDGSVVKCEECKTWHYVDKPCKCKITTIEEATSETLPKSEPITQNEVFNEIDDLDELFVPLQVGCCITCGKESDGNFFCKSCYFKYKEKGLCLKISKCKKVKILDAEYESDRICNDGHAVKSKSEREIDNYLYEKKIQHAYEWEVPIKGAKPIRPDFYLPDLDVYIEHWGYGKENIKYTEYKEYKLKIYKERGYTVICTHESTDTKNLSAALRRKLETYDVGKVNFENPND